MNQFPPGPLSVSPWGQLELLRKFVELVKLYVLVGINETVATIYVCLDRKANIE
jgi:hypothetical protein